MAAVLFLALLVLCIYVIVNHFYGIRPEAYTISDCSNCGQRFRPVDIPGDWDVRAIFCKKCIERGVADSF